VRRADVPSTVVSRGGAGHRASGFTLLELLVVLVVLGLLVVGLSQGLQVGVQAWHRQERVLGSIGELDAADRTLRHLIEQMDPGGLVEPSDISGTDQTLRFTSELPASAGAWPAQRAEVMLFVDRQHRLVLRWAPSLHVVSLLPVKPDKTILLSGVYHLQISYKGSAPAAPWQRKWQSPVPPLLVRVHIGFAPSDPRHWPDIIAQPMRERG
jgi:general secretion pathway protein J